MRFLVTISMLFSLSVQAQLQSNSSTTQDYEAGFNLTLNKGSAKKDFKTGRKLLEKADAHGDIRAAPALALTYLPGYGAKEHDYALAKKWFLKAAERGDAYSQWSLGHMYELGQGVSQAEAVKWFQKASDGDYGDASNSLGVMYLKGTGVPKDYKKAMDLFQKAIGKGSFDAVANIGQMYEEGWGVEKDKERAFIWYKQAYGKNDFATKKVDQSKKSQADAEEVVCLCEQFKETLEFNIEREKEIGRKTGVVDKVKLYGLGQKLVLTSELAEKLRKKYPNVQCSKKYDAFKQSDCVFKAGNL